MQYFNQEYIYFFEELKQNNNHEWFEQHYERFEKYVRLPFMQFTNEIKRRIEKYEPTLKVTSSEAIFRIDKDGKGDKNQPYRTHMSALISNDGRRSKEPGFYFQLGPAQCIVGGGLFAVSKDHLSKIRSQIAWHGNNEFEKLLKNPGFVSKFGTIQGEKNKKLPTDLKDAIAKHPLVANKRYFYTSITPCEIILNRSLPDIFMEFYKAGRPINEFLRRSMQIMN